MLEQRAEPAPAQRLGHTIPGQVFNPYPGKDAKSDLQGAGPIDTAAERILVEPGNKLGPEILQKLLAITQQVSLSQSHQVLVAIQLPDNLVIAHTGEIEVWNPAEIGKPTFPEAKIIAPPMNLFVGVDD